MKKIAWVVTELSDKQILRLPVLYSVVNEDGNPNVKLINCKVAAKPDDVPEWLSPTQFTIRQVYSKNGSGPGVTVTELGRIACANLDSANFVNRTHESIRVMDGLS